jgi:cytochrome c-type biogenesis protein CcmH/NrfG
LDRKETELRTDEAGKPAGPVSDVAAKTEELGLQGEELYRQGLFQQAIHVWTRILFLDRTNLEARGAIERAKRDIAERQRRLDLEIAEAARLFEEGDVEASRLRVRSVLSVDASHPEANLLAQEIAAHERRSEIARETPRGASEEAPAAPAKGIVLRVPKAPQSSHPAERPVASGLKMVFFVTAAVVLFSASALYLYANWDSLVSDGAFGHTGVHAPPSAVEIRPVPDLSELRYMNGARLFAQGRYREALAELGRVDRVSPVIGPARSLILRIEERLLRESPEAAGSTADGVESQDEVPEVRK